MWGCGVSDPRILTDYDPDLMAVFDDVDEFLDNESCSCDGTCECEEEG